MPSQQTQVAPPDVSIVIPVYNAMPYLTECLESVLNQTIGSDRIEIIAVDDGSTDGSRAELERFARAFPRIMTVLCQKNSGTPAAPKNRALQWAKGRFVFFVDADDYLGLDALRRLVTRADEWKSDVIFGTMVGENGRVIWQDIFRVTEPDLDLYNSNLPFTLASTKMYRRDMIEEYGLCFPEDLTTGEDQPFAIEAFVRSRRTSVVNDYDYYHAVKRADSGNITYATAAMERVRCTARIMDFTAQLIEAGDKRDAVLHRHFQWELTENLQFSFLQADEELQASLCEAIGALVDKYMTDQLRVSLSVFHRLRLGLAQAGDISTLCEVIRDLYGPERRSPTFVSDGQRILINYPGLDESVVDDAYYEEHSRKLVRDVNKLAHIEASCDGRVLTVRAELPSVERVGTAMADVIILPISSIEKSPKPRKLALRRRADGTLLTRVELIVAPSGRVSTMQTVISRKEWASVKPSRLAAIRLQFSIGDTLFDFPISGGGQSCSLRSFRRLGRPRPYFFAGSRDELLIQTSASVWIGVHDAIRRKLRRTPASAGD